MAKQEQRAFRRMRLKQLERVERPDGYDGALIVHIELRGGGVIEVEARAQRTERADGCTWSAEMAWRGALALEPAEVPVRVASTIAYGPVEDEAATEGTPAVHTNTVSAATTYEDGHQDDRTQQLRMPVPPLPSMSLEEFRERFRQFAAGQPFIVNQPELAFVDPLAFCAVMPYTTLVLIPHLRAQGQLAEGPPQ